MKKSFIITALLSFLLFNSFSQSKGTLTIKFTTTAYGGQYSPRHILAAWITNSATNSSSTFIKTVSAYTQNNSYKPYLTKWKTATNTTYNTTDATTGATLSSHGSLTGTWNSLTSLAATVPDGTYYIWVEFTEEASPKFATFSFTKGANATTTFTTVTSSSWITMNTLTWTPSSTAVEEVEAGKNYKIYPNPVKDYLNITGSALKKTNVYNSVGKLIYSTDANKINFSKYQKGAYVVEIITTEGTFYRKALKQ